MNGEPFFRECSSEQQSGELSTTVVLKHSLCPTALILLSPDRIHSHCDSIPFSLFLSVSLSFFGVLHIKMLVKTGKAKWGSLFYILKTYQLSKFPSWCFFNTVSVWCWDCLCLFEQIKDLSDLHLTRTSCSRVNTALSLRRKRGSSMMLQHHKTFKVGGWVDS